MITKNLIKFSITAFVLASLFRVGLSYSLAHEMFTFVWVVAAVYFVAMFASGWYFGKKDHEYLPIFDIGFRFHLATFVIHNGVSELWFLLGLNSERESVKSIHTTVLIWSLFLIFHFLFFLWAKKKSIKNLDRTELFE